MAKGKVEVSADLAERLLAVLANRGETALYAEVARAVDPGWSPPQPAPIGEPAQIEADRRHGHERPPLWRVVLGGCPLVRVRAKDQAEAIERYYSIVGVTHTSLRPAIELVEPAAV